MCALPQAHAAKQTVHKDRLVRVVLIIDKAHHPGEPQGVESPIVTGDTLEFRYVNTLLFLKEPCPLPIAGAENMFRAWFGEAAYQVGCWYPTENGDYVVIDGRGEVFPEDVYWQAEPRALLHPDNSVTIIEPNYNAETFAGNVALHKLQEMNKHLDEQP